MYFLSINCRDYFEQIFKNLSYLFLIIRQFIQIYYIELYFNLIQTNILTIYDNNFGNINLYVSYLYLMNLVQNILLLTISLLLRYNIYLFCYYFMFYLSAFLMLNRTIVLINNSFS